MLKLWEGYRKIEPWLSVITNFIFIAVLFTAIWLFALNKNDTSGQAILNKIGFQPIYVQTGSMEPAMKTNSIILVEKVESINDIAIGDIVTYQVQDETGRIITITHRIYNIKEDGTIITKGDNNRVADAYNLTFDNIRAKVVWIWNDAAVLQEKLQTPFGKYMAIVIILVIFVIFAWIGQLCEWLDEKVEKSKQLDVIDLSLIVPDKVESNLVLETYETEGYPDEFSNL